MFKSTVISTVFAVAAFQASAETSSKFDLSTLPPDVAARVVYLEQFGDRYENAIRAIIYESGKPASAFCDSEPTAEADAYSYPGS